MNITVYLGSCFGKDASLQEAVEQLGTWIGESGNTLVYGGSNTGLMGVLGDSALQAGAKVIGIQATLFVQQGVHHRGLTEMEVMEDISSRKKRMMEIGDAFIAFPGGTGTLEEIAEVMSQVSLKQLHAPCIFYNLNGYYNDMKALLNTMIESGLSSPERQEGIYFANNLEEIQAILHSYC